MDQSYPTSLKAPEANTTLPLETSHCISVDINELVEIEPDELIAPKRAILKQFQTTKFDWKDWKSSLLLPALRIYHFNERELSAHREFCLYDSRLFSDRMALFGPVSPRNENRCLIFIWKRLFSQQSFLSGDQALDLKRQLREEMEKLSLRYPPIFGPTQGVLDDDRSQKFHHYVESMRFKDVNSKLKLGNLGEVRGLITTSNIDAESYVLRLPIESILSYRSIANSPMKVLYEVEGLPEEISLVLFLIFEFYNDQSIWRPYLDMLPMEFDTALYFTDEEVRMVQGTTIGAEISMLQEKCRQTFDSVVPVLSQAYPSLFHPKIFTLENFIWAQAAFDSRGIRLNLDGAASLCLLPLVDAINGTTVSFLEGNTSISLDPDSADSYSIRTLLPISYGSQILMNYGAFSARELLLYYGYVDVNGVNEYDTFAFDLDVDDGPAGDLQTQILARLGVGLDQHLAFDGSVHAGTLMTLHVLLSTEDELIQLSLASDDDQLGSLLYSIAMNCPETRLSLRSLLSNLVDGIPSLPPSNSSQSIRIANVSYYLDIQRQIVQRAIDRLS